VPQHGVVTTRPGRAVLLVRFISPYVTTEDLVCTVWLCVFWARVRPSACVCSW